MRSSYFGLLPLLRARQLTGRCQSLRTRDRAARLLVEAPAKAGSPQFREVAPSGVDAGCRAAEPWRGDDFEGITEGDDAFLAELLAPFALELIDQSTPDPIGVVTLGGETDDLGATVVGIRHSLEITEPFEVACDLTNRLFCHAGQLGQLGESGAVLGIDVPENATVTRPDIAQPDGRELLSQLFDKEVGGHFEKPDHRRSGEGFKLRLHIVREADKVTIPNDQGTL